MEKKDIVLKKDQIRVLVSKDFKLKYNSTKVGYLWTLLVPSLQVFVYWLVFGIFMGMSRGTPGPRGEMARQIPYYIVYLACGTFLWQFFSNVVMMSGSVLTANGPLMKKTSFDRELLIWGTFYAEAFHFVLTIPVLAAIMICNGVMPDFLTFVPNVVVSLVSLMLFSVGLSFAYAACNLFFRDLERIFTIVMMLWMFVSPVFLSINIVPSELRWVYNLNPMALILQCWRDAFWTPCYVGALEVPPDCYYYGLTHAWHPGAYLPMLLVSAVTYFAGRAVFRKMEPAFAEMM